MIRSGDNEAVRGVFSVGGLVWDEARSEFQTPDIPRTDISVAAEGVAENGFFAVAEEGPTRTYRLNVTRQTCSDGMSDREYGWAASLFVESQDGNQMRT